jgi:hypothetical protein
VPNEEARDAVMQGVGSPWVVSHPRPPEGITLTPEPATSKVKSMDAALAAVDAAARAAAANRYRKILVTP